MRALILFFLILFTIGLSAAWIENVPNQLEQPDGTIIDVWYTGDEFHNWAHDENKYSIVQDEQTGYWCWAKSMNGHLVSTSFPTHLYNPESLGLIPGENISKEVYLQKRQAMDLDNNSRNDIRTPSVGVVQNLVVYIRFSNDYEFSRTVAYYDDMFNNTGENVNSLKQYFWDASYQQFEVNSPFFPSPPGDMIISYQSPHPRQYFQPYNSVSNPLGYQGGSYGWERQEREHALLRDAIIHIESQVPIDMIVDSDNDGYVDNVCFVIRGGAGAWASLLWPHRWVLYSYTVLLHGKQVWDYNFNIEDHMETSGVGVLAHEFAHSIGLPDFYRYEDNSITPVGIWDLMASDTTPPQAISAHARYKYTDWVTNMPIITTSGTYTLFPNTVSQSNHAYRINSPFSNTEYFVVEYRSNTTGLIDSTIPGSGLLVWRINPIHDGNASGPPDELYVYRPEGSPSVNGQIGQALFSAELGRTAINDFSNPRSFLSNGLAGGLFLYNVGFPDETISFDIIIGNADPMDFNESFENNVWTDFDWFNDPTAPWTITDQYASHGVFSAVSGEIGDSQSTKLELQMECGTGFFQFHLKTSTQQGGDFLRFYINGQETQNWSGNLDWRHFSTPILAGKYKFTWVYEKNASTTSHEDKVWIDQIGFPDVTGHILYPPTSLIHTVQDRDITFHWQDPYMTNLANPPILIGYDIYQNHLKLNNDPISGKSFVSENSTGGNMQFWVVAVYDIGTSDISNVTNVFLPFMTPEKLEAFNQGVGIRLNWEFPILSNTLVGFRVQRNGENISSPMLPSDVFTYYDTNVENGKSYTYQIRAMFLNPMGISDPSNSVEIVALDDSDDSLPIYINALGKNFPNPFNPETKITFSLEKNSHVLLEIFNIRGALVRTLTDDDFTKGNHSVIWNGTDNHGKSATTGVYFYRIKAEEFSSVKRMMLLK